MVVVRPAAPIATHALDAEAMARGDTPVASARGWGRVSLAALRVAGRVLRAPATPPDLALQDGDLLPHTSLQASVLHTPGHTPGSSCLVVEGRLAFAGDLISTHAGGHAQRYFAVDWAAIAASLARLQALEPELTYPGHGRHPLDGPALQRLRAPTPWPAPLHLFLSEGIRHDTPSDPGGRVMLAGERTRLPHPCRLKIHPTQSLRRP